MLYIYIYMLREFKKNIDGYLKYVSNYIIIFLEQIFFKDNVISLISFSETGDK